MPESKIVAATSENCLRARPPATRVAVSAPAPPLPQLPMPPSPWTPRQCQWLPSRQLGPHLTAAWIPTAVSTPSPPAHCLLESGVDAFSMPTTVNCGGFLVRKPPPSPCQLTCILTTKDRLRSTSQHPPTLSAHCLSLNHVNGQQTQTQTQRRTDIRNHKQCYPRRLNPCKCKHGPRSWRFCQTQLAHTNVAILWSTNSTDLVETTNAARYCCCQVLLFLSSKVTKCWSSSLDCELACVDVQHTSLYKG